MVSIRNEILELSKIKEPDVGTDHRVLEEQIKALKKQALAKKEQIEGPSPFVEILESAKKETEEKTEECKVKKAEIEEAEALFPYYDFWVTAFGDNGIRKFVIDKIIPALNSRIAYWLQFLFDNKFKLVFDNQLEETIERNPPDGNPFLWP